MKQVPKEVKDFITRLTALKAEAGNLQLYRTMHALEEPVTIVGYEVADFLQGKRTKHH